MGITDNIKSINLRRLTWLQRYTTFIHRFGGLSPFIAMLVLELTYQCNLRCEMCPQVADRDLGMSSERVSDMPLEMLRRVIDDAYQSFRPKPFVHLTGGEPLLHQEFIKVVGYIKSRGMRCSLTTNGSLLERYAADLVRVGIDNIEVSLDGPEWIHNDLRGAKWSYRRAIRGIEAILREKDQRKAKKPSITLNCVITGRNCHHLLDTVGIAAQVGIEALNFQHLMFEDCTDHGIDVEHLVRILPVVHNRAKRHHVLLSFYPRMSVRQVRRYYSDPAVSLGGTCVLPWFAMRVQGDGCVTPCRNFVFGAVTEEGFSLWKVWNNEMIRSYRRSIATSGLFPDCGRCCHRLYIG